jgi:hypothetical protein
MGRNGAAVYASYGTRLPIARLLPGVKVTVLGPPTLAQKAQVLRQRAVHRDEYWHFQAFWRLRADTAVVRTGTALFSTARTYRAGEIPPESRWFIDRVRQARGEALLRIVRAMDDALNNTSVILLIQAGRKRFLFPGDAQWENWEYALARHAADLRHADVYKVGHHGSLNATPRTLWNLFARRGTRTKTRRLTTLVSTRSNSKHGHRESRTEVPRDTLVAELRKGSGFRSTQESRGPGGSCWRSRSTCERAPAAIVSPSPANAFGPAPFDSALWSDVAPPHGACAVGTPVKPGPPAGLPRPARFREIRGSHVPGPGYPRRPSRRQLRPRRASCARWGGVGASRTALARTPAGRRHRCR